MCIGSYQRTQTNQKQRGMEVINISQVALPPACLRREPGTYLASKYLRYSHLPLTLTTQILKYSLDN